MALREEGGGGGARPSEQVYIRIRPLYRYTPKRFIKKFLKRAPRQLCFCLRRCDDGYRTYWRRGGRGDERESPDEHISRFPTYCDQ